MQLDKKIVRRADGIGEIVKVPPCDAYETNAEVRAAFDRIEEQMREAWAAYGRLEEHLQPGRTKEIRLADHRRCADAD
jgi:hypothetical protein